MITAIGVVFLSIEGCLSKLCFLAVQVTREFWEKEIGMELAFVSPTVMFSSSLHVALI